MKTLKKIKRIGKLPNVVSKHPKLTGGEKERRSFYLVPSSQSFTVLRVLIIIGKINLSEATYPGHTVICF